VSLPIAVRVLTLPRSQIFGVSIGAGTGWGLWLLIFCAAIMGATAAVVAIQLGRKVAVPDLAAWTNRWRRAAIGASAAIAALSVGFFAAHWDSGLDVKQPSTDFPSFHDDSSTTTSPSFTYAP